MHLFSSHICHVGVEGNEKMDKLTEVVRVWGTGIIGKQIYAKI